MNKHKFLFLIDKIVTNNIFGLIIFMPFILIYATIKAVLNELWWIIRDIKNQYERTIKST